ncbi:hypothetical protein H8D85_01430 [bacterium]|nr:hypothetical protein [bacterium]
MLDFLNSIFVNPFEGDGIVVPILFGPLLLVVLFMVPYWIFHLFFSHFISVVLAAITEMIIMKTMMDDPWSNPENDFREDDFL